MPSLLIAHPRASQDVETYARLRERVRETLLLGQARIEEAKVQTYWETGRHINEHVRIHGGRAEYGEKVILRLSSDLDLHDSVLRRCSQFAEKFETWLKICAGRHKLPASLRWSHFRALITVENEDKRLQFLDQAIDAEWTAEDLVREIKKINERIRESKNGRSKKPPELLVPRKGQVYTYRLVRHEKIHAGKADLRIDLGFSCYKEASMRGADRFKAGEIVESKWIKEDFYGLHASPASEAALYTYYAYIERVVDGDTLLVQVDLGFGQWTRQYLRLRGIDCPELDTSAGKRAKAFVEQELEGVPFITISSSKSDKYDRYLADIFYGEEGKEKFLNNELLKAGLAVQAK